MRENREEVVIEKGNYHRTGGKKPGHAEGREEGGAVGKCLRLKKKRKRGRGGSRRSERGENGKG